MDENVDMRNPNAYDQFIINNKGYINNRYNAIHMNFNNMNNGASFSNYPNY